LFISCSGNDDDLIKENDKLKKKVSNHTNKIRKLNAEMKVCKDLIDQKTTNLHEVSLKLTKQSEENKSLIKDHTYKQKESVKNEIRSDGRLMIILQVTLFVILINNGLWFIIYRKKK
jgi:hypothetical protein